MKEEREIWRQAKGGSGIYEVSNLGNFRKVAPGTDPGPRRVYIRENIGVVYMSIPVGTRFSGRTIYKSHVVAVKRLVFEAFGDEKLLNTHAVENIDRNPANNRVSNLRITKISTKVISNTVRDSDVSTGQREILDKISEVVCQIFDIDHKMLTGRSRKPIRTLPMKALTMIWGRYCAERKEEYPTKVSRLSVASSYLTVGRSTMLNHIKSGEDLYNTTKLFNTMVDLSMKMFFEGYQPTEDELELLRLEKERAAIKPKYIAKSRRRNRRKRPLNDSIHPLAPEHSIMKDDTKAKIIKMFEQEYSVGYIDTALDLTAGLAAYTLKQHIADEEKAGKNISGHGRMPAHKKSRATFHDRTRYRPSKGASVDK